MKVVSLNSGPQRRILQMFDAGRTDDEISLATGYKMSTIEKYRSELGLTRERNPNCKPLGIRAEISPPPPPERPNPMLIAMNWLGSRLVEKPSGYWMDGCPVNLLAIMKETNRLLKLAGADQVGPTPWRV